MVRGSWIKPGAVIIDVGINPVDVSRFISRPCFYCMYALGSFSLGSVCRMNKVHV
jgi:hypothetical protein